MAGAVLVDGDRAAVAIALVTVGEVLLALLVDLHIAIVVQDVLGGGVVVLAILGDVGAVVAAAEQLLDEGFVALAALGGGGLAAGLGVLPHGRAVFAALLVLQRLVVLAHRLAGEGVIVGASGLLGDLAAIFEQLLAVAGVVRTTGGLVDAAGAVFLHRQVVVALAGLRLGGRGERCNRLLHLGDVLVTVLRLVRGAVVSHDLAGQGQEDSGA